MDVKPVSNSNYQSLNIEYTTHNVLSGINTTLTCITSVCVRLILMSNRFRWTAAVRKWTVHFCFAQIKIRENFWNVSLFLLILSLEAAQWNCQERESFVYWKLIRSRCLVLNGTFSHVAGNVITTEAHWLQVHAAADNRVNVHLMSSCLRHQCLLTGWPGVLTSPAHNLMALNCSSVQLVCVKWISLLLCLTIEIENEQQKEKTAWFV